MVGGRRGPCEEYDRVEGEDEEEVEDYATLGSWELPCRKK